MKKSHFFVFLGTLIVTLSFSQQDKKIIYKWEKNGLVHYSHIKPEGAKNIIKLDADGRKIENYSENFGEIVQIVVSPKKHKQTLTDTSSNRADNTEEQADKQRREYCQIARQNLQQINSGDLYERNAKGELIRLSNEQLKTKRIKAERDVTYYCTE